MSGADYRIAWRPKASEDLRSIVRYIAVYNSDAACRVG